MSAAQQIDLTGRHVAVVGATGGVGEGVCRELLRLGAHIVAIGRDRGRLESLAIRLDVGQEHLTLLVANVAAADGTETPTGETTEATEATQWFQVNAGRLDGVFVAIGYAGVPGPGTVLDITDAEARAMIEVNELGGLRVLRLLVPLLRPDGALVNVLGYSAEIPFPGNPLMGSTNAAMRSLLMTLAHQLRERGPRIYALVLGVVRTRARQAAGVDDSRWLTGDEVGAFTAALVTGQVEEPGTPLRYLLDPAHGPSLHPPRRG